MLSAVTTANKKHHSSDRRRQKKRQNSQSSYSFASERQRLMTEARNERERIKMAHTDELAEERAKHQRREKVLLETQKELQRQVLLKNSTLEPAHLAYEMILTLCLNKVMERNSLLEATASSSDTATEWKFHDINGHMTPVHPSIIPVLDKFDQLSKGAIDSFATPEASNNDALKEMLHTGEITPLYNGFAYFGGLYKRFDDQLYKVDKSGMTNSITTSAEKHIIDGFDDFPMDLCHTLSGESDEVLNPLVWCYQLDFAMAGSKPCVISDEKRFQHPYLLLFGSLSFFAIPYGNNLYLCRATTIDETDNGREIVTQVFNFYSGNQNLINLLLLVTAKSHKLHSGNWRNIVFPQRFKKQFQNHVVNPLPSMFEDTSSELGAMDVNTESKNIHVPLHILRVLRFLGWKENPAYNGFTVDDETSLLMIELPVLDHMKWSRSSLYICDIRADQFEELGKNLYFCAFYSNGAFNRGHFWLQLHGSGGAYNYYYTLNLLSDGSITQKSKHNQRVATISNNASIKITDEHWSSMTLQLTQEQLGDLKIKYSYDKDSYLFRSKTLSRLGNALHKFIPSNKHTFDSDIGSMMIVNGARFRTFLHMIENRFNGGIRFCVHGTPSIAEIAKDPNGFNLTFAGKTHGSAYGPGIYLAFDPKLAHQYSGSTSHVGNVLFVLCGWLPLSEWKEPYPDPKNELLIPHKLSFPACKMFQHSSRVQKYWDGAVFSQETEMHVMGEMVADGNPTISKSSGLIDITPWGTDLPTDDLPTDETAVDETTNDP